MWFLKSFWHTYWMSNCNRKMTHIIKFWKWSTLVSAVSWLILSQSFFLIFCSTFLIIIIIENFGNECYSYSLKKYFVYNAKIGIYFFRIIVVQSENAAEDDVETEQTGTIKRRSDRESNPGPSTSIPDGATEFHEINQGVNLYILAGHENMQL